MIENLTRFSCNVFDKMSPLSAIIHYKPNTSSTSSVLAEKQQKEVFAVFSGKLP